MKGIAIMGAALFALAAPAFAQDATTIQVADSDQYGEHLVTGDGRPVYLFTTDTQATGDREAQISCVSQECLDAWPLVTTQGEPQAGEGASADMLATMEYEGQTVVTYNGWPLYYFARDTAGDPPQGHEIESFGGEWYLITSQGEEARSE